MSMRQLRIEPKRTRGDLHSLRFVLQTNASTTLASCPNLASRNRTRSKWSTATCAKPLHQCQLNGAGRIRTDIIPELQSGAFPVSYCSVWEGWRFEPTSAGFSYDHTLPTRIVYLPKPCPSYLEPAQEPFLSPSR